MHCFLDCNNEFRVVEGAGYCDLSGTSDLLLDGEEAEEVEKPSISASERPCCFSNWRSRVFSSNTLRAAV